MCVRILIIITKRPLRHATEVDVSVAKTLGQSVTKRLDHNSLSSIAVIYLTVLYNDVFRGMSSTQESIKKITFRTLIVLATFGTALFVTKIEKKKSGKTNSESSSV